MEERNPKRSQLYPGQVLHQHAFRGMTVVVLRGEIRLSIPARYIGEHTIRNTVILQEGQAHSLESTGWIVIDARTAGEIACIASTSKTGAWRCALLAAWHWALRRRRLAYGKMRES